MESTSRNGLDTVELFQQFFVPGDPSRATEIQFCLKMNCNNPAIDKVVLLNERKYTLDELGLSSDEGTRVTQVVIGRRLVFSDFFAHAARKLLSL